MKFINPQTVQKPNFSYIAIAILISLGIFSILGVISFKAWDFFLDYPILQVVLMTLIPVVIAQGINYFQNGKQVWRVYAKAIIVQLIFVLVYGFIYNLYTFTQMSHSFIS